MGRPRVVEGDLDTAVRAERVEVALEQLALVRAAFFDVDGHGEEVADVAEVGAHTRPAPVEEADAIAVEEDVADVQVAVDVGRRSGMPDLVEPRVVVDVELADRGVVGGASRRSRRAPSA
jgi:hypothetical protein